MNDFLRNGPLSQIAAQLTEVKKGIRELKATILYGNLVARGYTTAERNALTGVANGTIIYNTTTNKLQVYAGGVWVDLH